VPKRVIAVKHEAQPPQLRGGDAAEQSHDSGSSVNSTSPSEHAAGGAPLCPADGMLAAFATGDLCGAELQHVEEHVSCCEECLLVLVAVLQSSSEPAGPSRGDVARAPAGALISERFELGDLIAEGGMGRVYSGRDLQTGERVAIKCIRTSHAAAHPESLIRFLREAEILGKLAHPNIVRRIAMVEAEQRWHIVMEYVPGGSLRDLSRAGPRLPVERVLRMGLEVADALARAHHLGIVHRDLKPDNVLLAADGTPRLSDFGLARGVESSITRSGVVLGTLAYVSPEALAEREVDARADIWALGVMLFELLTGERPFVGHTVATVLTAILHRQPRQLVRLCPELPTGLSDLLQRMLEKDPAQRVSSARQVGAELEAIARDLSVAAPPASTRRTINRPPPWGAVVVRPAAARRQGTD
jgi:serine/threonine protein kinase